MKGTYLADLVILPSLHPRLHKINILNMLVKKGLSTSDCLQGDILNDLTPEDRWNTYMELYGDYYDHELDLSEMTEVNSLDRSNMPSFSSSFSSIQLTHLPTYPPDFEKLMKLNQPSDLHGPLTPPETVEIFYSIPNLQGMHPRNACNFPCIHLPIQKTVCLKPSEKIIFDTLLNFSIPPEFFGLVFSKPGLFKIKISTYTPL